VYGSPHTATSSLTIVPCACPSASVAPLTFVDWTQQSKSLPALAAFRQLRYAFAGDGEPLDVPSVRGTANMFTVLRANAMLGRTFSPGEGEPGADRVAIARGALELQFEPVGFARTVVDPQLRRRPERAHHDVRREPALRESVNEHLPRRESMVVGNYRIHR